MCPLFHSIQPNHGGRKATNLEDADGFDWWSAVRYDLPPLRRGLFGDFHRSYFLAIGETPIAPGEKYEVHIYSDRRTRVARLTWPN